jgi:nucleotide-binding universal stress UspA family protein
MHKVLLAIDGSKPAHEAAALLAHLPHPDRLDLTVLSVVQRPFIHSSYATGELLEKAFERDKELAAETFREVAQMFDGANADVRHEMREGPIGEAIVESAKKSACDLIVVGAKGHSQIGRMLLGSVSDHVATHATCSTLVVRPTDVHEVGRPIRVCLAYEGAGSAVAALEEIAEIPWRTGTDFHLLSVATYLSDFVGERRDFDESDVAEQYYSDLRQAKQRLSEVAPNAQTHLIRSDHIGEGIVAFAEDNHVDLVVVGETPRSAMNRFLLGSTSRYVLRHAPCSVWVTRNRMLKGLKKGDTETETVAG